MTFSSKIYFRSRFALAAVIGLGTTGFTLGEALPSRAQMTFVWNGGTVTTTNSNWSMGDNWVGGTAPIAGGSASDFLSFTGSAPLTGLTTTDDLGSTGGTGGTFTLNTLGFDASAGSYVITGNPTLNFATFSSLTPTIRVETISPITINSPLSLANSLTVGSYTSNNSSGTLTSSVNGSLTINGAITGTTSTNLTNFLSSLTLTGGGTFGTLYTNFTGAPSGSMASTAITGGTYTLVGLTDGVAQPSSLTISGATTTVNATAGTGLVRIGFNSNGTMSLQAGATLQGTNYFLGATTGASGTGTIDGRGTTLTSTATGMDGNLSVAYAANTTATLTIQNGGSASVNNIFIGGVGSGSGSANGTLNITSAGITAAGGNTNALQANTISVGDLGTGTLSVSGGGNINTASNVFVGQSASSTGHLTVGVNTTDPVSSLMVGGNLEIGGASGTTGGIAQTNLTKANVSVAGNMNLYSNSTGSSVFNATSSTITVGGLNSAGATSIGLNLTNTTLTFGTANNTTTYNGSITGSGNTLNKVGTGATTFSGSSSYTGSTNVNAGTLVARGSALGSDGTSNSGSAVTVYNGATLAVGEAANTTNSSQGVGTLSALSLSVVPLSNNTTPLVTFNLGANGTNDVLTLTGMSKPLTFDGAGSFLIGFASATGTDLSSGIYDLINFPAQMTSSLPALNLYTAKATGNLSSLPAGTFTYITTGNQATGLQYSIVSTDGMPEPGAGVLALGGLTLMTGFFTLLGNSPLHRPVLAVD